MKREELNQLFTEKVTEYIKNGYIIHSNSMCGSNGCSARVDLVNGNNFIRVFMEKNYRNGTRIESICVGHKVLNKGERECETIWQSSLTIIEKTEFYCLEYLKWYVTEAEYDEIRQKRKKRYENFPYVLLYNHHNNSLQVKQIVLPFLRRQPRCKSVKLSDITSITKNQKSDGKIIYGVHAKGKYYVLH